jgi:hypothetical protein
VCSVALMTTQWWEEHLSSGRQRAQAKVNCLEQLGELFTGEGRFLGDVTKDRRRRFFGLEDNIADKVAKA